MPSTQGPSFRPLEPDDPRRLGDYQLRARLGAGGMGRVYLGATSTGRRLAVKVVRSEYASDPEFRSRFRREIDAALRVRGRYTAAVVDADPESERPWLATEYIPGPSLSAAVAGHGPLPEATVRILVAGIAEALYAVHRAGVVHRDLKPSNVLLGPDGPCVIDFGIARAADATPLTRSGYQLGTPVFMAPEQVRGEPATEAADVWALGGLAFFAATGEKPFGDGPDSAVLYRVVHEQPCLDRCPAYLRALVGACLDKDPDRRPSLRAVLEQFPAPADLRGWLPGSLREAVATYAETPRGPLVVPIPPVLPGADSTPMPSRSRRDGGHPGHGRRSAVLAGVASFVVVLGAGGVAAVLLHRAQGDSGGAADTIRTTSTTSPTSRTSAAGAPAPGTYRINRQITDTGDWRLVLTDIVVGNRTMTAHVAYQNVHAVDPGLTCLYNDAADANSVEYADGTVVTSTQTYCSTHPDATWDVPRGKSWTGYAVFPAPTSGQSFTLHWRRDKTGAAGDVAGITLG